VNEIAANMHEIEVELPRKVDRIVADDIEKESVFVSTDLERITVDLERGMARLLLKTGDNIEEVVDKAKRYLEVMAKQISGFDIKTFSETKRRDQGEYIRSVNEKLVDKGWLFDYGMGQVAYSGPVLKLAQMINKKAGELYSDAFGAVDGSFPALVEADTLQKCGYFDSHPNAVTLLANIVEDFDAIEEFRVANSCADGAILPQPDHVHIDGICLNPAACFPCYPTLAGKTYDTGECFTWLGRVFRYESRNINGLDRLYEFNVRELVFVGSEDYVVECRTKALPLIEELASYFDLDCKIQSATDPFFATVSAAKKFYQAAEEVKAEIKIPVLDKDGKEKLLACGSINLHGNFFGKKFEINALNGSVAHTGCVGLGIERWVLAAFTQHGFDERRWPENVSNEIFA
jgi:seryl-tRNA synthetase